MMVMTTTAMVTAIKFLYCYNFDCFYEGLSPKKDSPFSLNPAVSPLKGILRLRYKSCCLMSHSG